MNEDKKNCKMVSNDLMNIQQKIIELYKNNKPIVPYMIGFDYNCDGVNVDIEDIGRGKQGSVYKIKIEKDECEYVLKKYEVSEYEKIKTDGKVKLKEILIKMMDDYDLTKEEEENIIKMIIKYNKIKKEELDQRIKKEIIIPNYYFPCRATVKNLIVNSQGIDILIENGDYVCRSNIITEYLNTLLGSILYEKGISTQFLKTIGFKNCNGEPNMYIERIKMDLYDALEEKIIIIINILYFQYYIVYIYYRKILKCNIMICI